MKLISCLLVSPVLCLLLSGCGNPNLGQVSGTVTYDGKPLDSATVAFMPESRKGILAVATTDPKGRYVLSAPIKKGVTQGALAGNYRVAISKKEIVPDADELLYSKNKISYDELQERLSKKDKNAEINVYDLIPAHYGLAETSGLTATVEAKVQNVFDFNLTK